MLLLLMRGRMAPKARENQIFIDSRPRHPLTVTPLAKYTAYLQREATESLGGRWWLAAKSSPHLTSRLVRGTPRPSTARLVIARCFWRQPGVWGARADAGSLTHLCMSIFVNALTL